jgi:hypothetical protein
MRSADNMEGGRLTMRYFTQPTNRRTVSGAVIVEPRERGVVCVHAVKGYWSTIRACCRSRLRFAVSTVANWWTR